MPALFRHLLRFVLILVVLMPSSVVSAQGDGTRLTDAGAQLKAKIGRLNEELKRRRTTPARRRELIEQMVTLMLDAGADGKARLELMLRSDLAGAFESEGLFKEARTEFLVALDLGRRLRLGEAVVRALSGLSGVHNQLGDLKAAVAAGEEGLKLIDDLDNPALEATLCNRLGTAHHRLGNYSEAIAAYQSALEIGQDLDNPAAIQVPLNNLGLVAMEAKRYDLAKTYLERVLDLAQKHATEASIVSAAMANLGTVASLEKRYDDALVHHRAARKLRHDAGLEKAEALSLFEIGVVAKIIGKFQIALAHLKQALAIQDLHDDMKIEKIATLTHLAQVYAELDNTDEAIRTGGTALRLAEAAGTRELRLEALITLARAHEQDGNSDAALETRLQAARIESQSEFIRTQTELKRFRTDYEAMKRKADATEKEVEATKEQLATERFRRNSVLVLGGLLLFLALGYLWSRRRDERRLRASAEEHRMLMHEASDAIFLCTPDGLIQNENPSASELVKSASSHEGTPFSRVFARLDGSPLDLSEIARQSPFVTEVRLLGRDDDRHAELSAKRLADGRILANVRDITERRRAENERRQLDRRLQDAQRLESLGILAGGVAHDFNNILTGILGHASLAMAELPPGSGAKKDIESVETAARRAADLTEQLLAYAGRSPSALVPLDLNQATQSMKDLLDAIIARRHQLKIETGEFDTPVIADKTQVRQVVMNLVTNAADAMPEDEEGTITVRTRSVHLDDNALAAMRVASEKAEPGLYAILEVEDRGSGMDEWSLSRIFDPFYTTKFTGHGLGMAAVLGIVHAHRGAIDVHSESGEGTRIEVAFPCESATTSDEESGATNRTPTPNIRDAREILVVDDEDGVREVARRILLREGYGVTAVSDGDQAVEFFERMGDEISVVMLDLTMPGKSGLETLAELRAVREDVPVIVSSGNSVDVTRLMIGIPGPPLHFLRKPYSVEHMVEAISRALPQVDLGLDRIRMSRPERPRRKGTLDMPDWVPEIDPPPRG